MNIFAALKTINSTTMWNTNNLVFKGLHVIAWIIFVGLCIEAGGLLVNFIISLYKPSLLPNLYQKLDLTALYESSRWAFVGSYSFILAIAALKASLFYTVVMLMHKMELGNPFTPFVARRILLVSYNTLAIGLLSYLAREFTRGLAKRGFITDSLHQFWHDSQAFVLMGAVVYIIAIIIKRGVEIQSENELTI